MGKTAAIRPVTTVSMKLASKFGAIKDELSGSFHSSQFSSQQSSPKNIVYSDQIQSHADKFFGKGNDKDKGQGGGKGGFAM